MNVKQSWLTKCFSVKVSTLPSATLVQLFEELAVLAGGGLRVFHNKNDNKDHKTRVIASCGLKSVVDCEMFFCLCKLCEQLINQLEQQGNNFQMLH